MKQKERATNITVRFAGRRAYEVKFEQGGKEVRRIIYIPLFNSSKRFSKRIHEIVEELLLMDYNVSAAAVYIAIEQEANAIEHSIPKFLDHYEMDLY